MARPLKEIEPWQVYKCARIGCTNVEIAVILGCSEDTLTRRFADVLRKGRQKMNMSLRRMQYKAACAGDRTILIWLGKQYLGQRDKQEVDLRLTDERDLAHSTAEQAITGLLRRCKVPETDWNTPETREFAIKELLSNPEALQPEQAEYLRGLGVQESQTVS